MIGNWAWRRPDIPAVIKWPGHKVPGWVKNVVVIDNCWYWSDKE